MMIDLSGTAVWNLTYIPFEVQIKPGHGERWLTPAGTADQNLT